MPPDGGRAIVLADGGAPTRRTLDEAWPDWAHGASLVVAADGGARHAAALGLPIGRWVGDGDSVDPADLAALAATGVRIDRVPVEKDATDTELALLAALEVDPAEVVLLGALGGARLDHALANLGLLHHPALGPRPLVLYDEQGARISILTAADGGAARRFAGRVGDLVTLLPLGETAVGVTTEGLRYPLVDEPLTVGRTRGVSNVRTALEARVALRSGRLLVIETPVRFQP